MSNHQQGLIPSVQETLEPLDHLQVEMVRRFIKNQQIRIGNQHIRQSHTLLLSTTQLSHRLLKVTDLQLCQDLFGLEHPLRISLMVDFVELCHDSAINAGIMALAAPSFETSIEHTFRRIEYR